MVRFRQSFDHLPLTLPFFRSSFVRPNLLCSDSLKNSTFLDEDLGALSLNEPSDVNNSINHVNGGLVANSDLASDETSTNASETTNNVSSDPLSAREPPHQEDNNNVHVTDESNANNETHNIIENNNNNNAKPTTPDIISGTSRGHSMRRVGGDGGKPSMDALMNDIVPESEFVYPVVAGGVEYDCFNLKVRLSFLCFCTFENVAIPKFCQ